MVYRYVLKVKLALMLKSVSSPYVSWGLIFINLPLAYPTPKYLCCRKSSLLLHETIRNLASKPLPDSIHASFQLRNIYPQKNLLPIPHSQIRPQTQPEERRITNTLDIPLLRLHLEWLSTN